MVKYKTIPQFSAESGYTPAACRTKIRDGVWIEDKVWVKAPDGRILINVEGYYEWVEKSKVSGRPVKRQLKSPLPIGRRGAGNGSNLSPPPLT